MAKKGNRDHPLIHSDRGFQYTSHGFKRRIEGAGMTHSMSRIGKCIDNGPMESFWGALKCEKYYLHKYEAMNPLRNSQRRLMNIFTFTTMKDIKKG